MKKKYFASVYKGQGQSKYRPEDNFVRRLAGKAYVQQIKGIFNQRPFAREMTAQSGFTLIELLVVIGIIAILAAATITAINPARQFALARNTQRMANVAAILDGVNEYMTDHSGIFDCGGPNITNGLSLPTSPEDISSDSPDADIAGCLVPKYMADMPFDPLGGGYYTGTKSYETHYFISQDESGNGHVTVSATGELGQIISVTR